MKWRRIAEKEAKKVFQGKQTGIQLMAMIGVEAANDIKDNIKSLESPPLSPTTIERRRQIRSGKGDVGLLTKPLIDTGLMLETCTHIVEIKK